MKIAKGKYVELQYALSFDSFDGEIVEETTLDDPMQIEIGTDEMLPAFEEKIMGLAVGDEFRFKIPTQDAFGEYVDDNLIEIPKAELKLEGGQKMPEFSPGDVISVHDGDGEEVPVEIIEVKNDAIVVDGNHPLAGEDLYFQGRVLAIDGAIE